MCSTLQNFIQIHLEFLKLSLADRFTRHTALQSCFLLQLICCSWVILNCSLSLPLPLFFFLSLPPSLPQLFKTCFELKGELLT